MVGVRFNRQKLVDQLTDFQYLIQFGIDQDKVATFFFVYLCPLLKLIDIDRIQFLH
jgi:hypothetical protein